MESKSEETSQRIPSHPAKVGESMHSARASKGRRACWKLHDTCHPENGFAADAECGEKRKGDGSSSGGFQTVTTKQISVNKPLNLLSTGRVPSSLFFCMSSSVGGGRRRSHPHDIRATGASTVSRRISMYQPNPGTL